MLDELVAVSAVCIELNVGADRLKKENAVIRSAPFFLSKPTSINRVKRFAFDLVYVHYFVSEFVYKQIFFIYICLLRA